MPVDPDLQAAEAAAEAIPIYEPTQEMMDTWNLWNLVSVQVKAAVTSIVKYLDRNEGVIDCAVGQVLIFNSDANSFNPNSIFTPNGMRKYPGVWTKITGDQVIAGSDSSHAAGTTYKDGSEAGEHKSITMTLEIGRFTSHFA
jgi:hypothetical protein